MKKKILAVAAVAVLTLSMSVTAFAQTVPYQGRMMGNANQSRTYAMPGYGFMMDENGNFVDRETFEANLDRETFEANLDRAIANGEIRAEDRDFYTQMFDWCTTGGGGRGRGMMGRGSFGSGNGFSCH